MPPSSAPGPGRPVRHFLRTCGKDPLPISLVRQALDLPPVPYAEFLGPECWLAGGAVLKWLLNRETFGREAARGDYDFYFPSARALDATARAMMARGFRLLGHRAWSLTLREYLRGATTVDRESGLWDGAGRMAPITDELIRRLRLAYLDLRSPQGDIVQLVAFFSRAPSETIARFDFSVCQLAADHEALSLGAWTASDLLNHRLRLVNVRVPDSTFRRLIKYARRGYRPSLAAIAKAFYLLMGQGLQRGPRLLLASFRLRPPSGAGR